MPDYSLFPNGTSHMIWREQNCDQCIKRYVESKMAGGVNDQCPIEHAIALAAATDGSLFAGGIIPHNKAAALAARLNWDGESYLEHGCQERVK